MQEQQALLPRLFTPPPFFRAASEWYEQARLLNENTEDDPKSIQDKLERFNLLRIKIADEYRYFTPDGLDDFWRNASNHELDLTGDILNLDTFLTQNIQWPPENNQWDSPKFWFEAIKKLQNGRRTHRYVDRPNREEGGALEVLTCALLCQQLGNSNLAKNIVNLSGLSGHVFTYGSQTKTMEELLQKHEEHLQRLNNDMSLD